MENTMMTRSRILLFSVIGLFLTTSIAHGQSAQEIAKKAFGGTVLLVMEDANNQPISLGSGFFVRAGEIASNLHVVEGAAKGYAKKIGEKTKYNIEGITAIDAERDLVVLKISDGNKDTGRKGILDDLISAARTLPLGNSDAVQVGESIYAVGNPLGLEGTFSQGIVSSIRGVDTYKLLQITAPISSGSSGGPVLNGKGEVIGVSVATFKAGQNLNFAIPSNYLKILVANAGQVKPLAQGRATKSQRSILSDLGGRNAESVVGSHFSWTYPGNGYFTFSVRNNLRESVKNVVCLVIFYGRDGLPIETEQFVIPGPIGGNLAKRSALSGRNPAAEVKDLTEKIEIRVLDFQLAE